MKLLLDQGMPLDAASLLRLLGHECVHVSEIQMQRATDEAILERAVNEGAIVVTLDADFHTLVAVRGLTGPSVIRLRKEGCRAEEATFLVQEVLARHGASLVRGCLVSIKNRRTTVHRLPIGSEQ